MDPLPSLSSIKTHATRRLKEAEIPDAERTVITLLQHVTGATVARLIAGNVDISREQVSELMNLVERRVEREPLQYILGKWPFWKHEFAVTPDVLIPRPETERILEVLADKIPKESNGYLLDCCTGSGCLAISAAFEHPRLSIVGSDISPAALNVAESNRRNLNCRHIQWICADMLNAFREELLDIIIANPPYVACGEAAKLEPELSHEPAIALFSGTEGMDHIHQLLSSSARILKKGGLLIFEFGYNQGKAVRSAVQHVQDRTVRLEIATDLRGVERIGIVEFI